MRSHVSAMGFALTAAWHGPEFVARPSDIFGLRMCRLGDDGHRWSSGNGGQDAAARRGTARSSNRSRNFTHSPFALGYSARNEGEPSTMNHARPIASAVVLLGGVALTSNIAEASTMARSDSVGPGKFARGAGREQLRRPAVKPHANHSGARADHGEQRRMSVGDAGG